MCWTKILERRGLDGEDVEWGRQYPDFPTAWKSCTNHIWMADWAGRVSGPPLSGGRKKLVLALCECVRTVRLSAATEKAFAVAESWARGEVEDQDMQRVVARVRRTRLKEGTWYPGYATTAMAAIDVMDSGVSEYPAATAATAARYAAYAAGAFTAAAESRYADILRRHYPEPPMP